MFVPQEEAEVDFGEVWVVLAGVKTKCHLFAFRLSHSGKAIHRSYPTQAQEAFLEGHIDAFEDIGGIPTRHIRYDNLTDAVVKVIYGTGRQRAENQRWLLFRSHYGFDAFYCHPGIEGAHEKGDVRPFRRTHLSPMPVVDTLADLNNQIKQWDLDDEDRRIGDRIRTVAQDFALERELLASITPERFEPGLSLTPRVSRSSLVWVRMASYSVPARFIGRQVRVSLRASEVICFEGRTEIARHPRVVAMHWQSVNLDHHLEVLQHKRGALPGSTVLANARASGVFTAAHEAFWAAARKTDGDAGGTRALIDVLLLHRSMAAEDVIAGITTTLRRRRGLSEEAANVSIDQACRRLRLPTIRADVEEATTAAQKEQLSYQGFLAELLLAECDARDRRSSVRRVKAGGFPRDKGLRDFDFDANPNINPATINTLTTGD